MSEKKYLFLFTITPVQSFLSQARKTQDLFAGSQILSDLIKAGIRAFGEDILFPNTQDKDKVTYPNRFLGKSTEASIEFGERVEKAVKIKLKEIATKALRRNDISDFSDYYNQVESYFNFFWLFEEIKDGNYREAYLNIERKLGAIKNLREFEQSPEIGRKCSLTGAHNALFFKPNTNNLRNPVPAFINSEKNDYKFQNKVTASKLELKAYITESQTVESDSIDFGEGLSAIAYLKRFYKDRNNEKFPSTARVASMNVLKAIEGSQELEDYKRLFENGKKYDEQLLYEENIRMGYFEKQGLSGLLSEHYAFYPYTNTRLFTKKSKNYILGKIVEEFEANIEEFKKEHKKIKSLISNISNISNNDVVLSSYYALLLFDADNMGAWLNGEDYLPKDKLENLEAYHNFLSGLLTNFAKKAKEYLDDNYRGKTVYAGGDDFMGFINLKSLFEVLTFLRKSFKTDVSDELIKRFDIPPGKHLNFSAGLIIAGYKHPLSDVLVKVRAAEKEAKKIDGKNALSITVLKNSGETVQTVLNWKQGRAIDDLKTINEQLDTNFSTKFIHSLHLELDIYKNYDLSNIDSTAVEKIVNVETKRLIKRACQLTNKEAKEKNSTLLHQALMELFENCRLRTKEIYNFLDLLQVIDFLKRKAKI